MVNARAGAFLHASLRLCVHGADDCAERGSRKLGGVGARPRAVWARPTVASMDAAATATESSHAASTAGPAPLRRGWAQAANRGEEAAAEPKPKPGPEPEPEPERGPEVGRSKAERKKAKRERQRANKRLTEEQEEEERKQKDELWRARRDRARDSLGQVRPLPVDSAAAQVACGPACS